MTDTAAFRCGLVALAGRPNVGKSTLVNAICGEHVSIVSERPQTTRRRIAGIANGDGWQLVLLDLPGFQRPLDGLTDRMQRSVDETLADVDVVLVVLDATTHPGSGDLVVVAAADRASAPTVLVLNKVDRLTPREIAVRIEGTQGLLEYEALHPVSARTGDGVAALRKTLVELLPVGPALYPIDVAAADPLLLRIAELVREQALRLTREEVPHALTVVVEELAPATRRHIARVEAAIVCETEAQKRILVGKGGSMVRQIGAGARPAIESVLGGQVMLELRVRVEPGWRDDPHMLDRLGP